MQASLSSLVDNLAGVNDVKCKSCKKTMEFLEIDSDYIAHFKCDNCCEYGEKQLDKEDLLKRFSNTYRYAGEDEQFRLLLRKGVYPYEYMDSFERFEEKELPQQEAFYSNLNLSGISNNDYTHAQKVWKAFECRDLGDYHDLYLTSDVLLLADVFERFRDVCQDIYGLDPAHFYTAPGLAWQAALKKTEVRLELLTDIDMLLMVEKGIRGGICQVIQHYAKASNKYMGEHSNQESYLQYLDANNLYGWAMVQKLPTHNFKWVNAEDFTAEKIHKYENGDTGYILEVDIEYPKTLQIAHNELPFLPEKMKLTNGIEKLTCNLYDKEKYVVHIRTLQQALEHGLKLSKIHRVIEFKQEAWLKPYIDMNTEHRTKAENNFEKDFFKLMNNSVFGKTMENVRNHKDIKLVCTEGKRKRLTSKPNYRHTIRFSEQLIAVDMRKTKVVMNKPVYLGQAILDLSKIVMYEFNYDYIKPKYGNKAKLCYMDTDSFVYHFKTEDFYKDIAADVAERFDTSSYDEGDKRPLPMKMNRKKIGLMKDELGGKIMTEFVALRPKMYAYKQLDGKVDKKCKGIKKCVVKKHISFDDYLKCCKDGKLQYRSQLAFRSRKHVMFTQRINKIALSKNDDKRLQDADGIYSWAHGSSAGLVCKSELLMKAWHPKRVIDWCFSEDEKRGMTRDY